MIEKEMDDLLKDLAARGFNDDQLRQDIEKNEAYGLPRFSISRIKEFGEERMNYKLTFQWMESSLGYEFTAIHANYRMPVNIIKNVINGIDSIQLDQEMSTVDWTKYWERKQKGEPPSDDSAMAAGCIDGLAQLLLSESYQAKFTGESLMYKHWPADVFNIFTDQPDKMRRLYEQDYHFEFKSHPDITEKLAYLIVSERIGALKMHLSDLGVTQIPESIIENEAHNILKDYPDKTVLKFSFSDKEYYATLAVPIFLDNGWYNQEGYTLGLVQLPEIKHGTFNGVDSERLEKKLATVNWKEDKDIFIKDIDSVVEFPKDIELLMEELFRMAFEPEGREAADLLMLKHWLCAPIFEDFISEQAKERLFSLPIKAARFPSDIQVGKALALLSGRPVLKELSADQEHGVWQRIVSPADESEAKLETFTAISKKNLGSIYDMMPIPANKKEIILRKLLNGKEVVVQANNGQMIRLELTENVDGIRIFDSKRQEIPFNLQLAPDWKPEPKYVIYHREKRQKREEEHQESIPKNKVRKNKGKGL